MVNVGIDLHKTQFTVCVRDGSGGGDRFSQYPTTDAGYEGFLRQTAVWQGAGETVRVGVESTGNTRYFKNRMEAAKGRNRLSRLRHRKKRTRGQRKPVLPEKKNEKKPDNGCFLVDFL